MWSQTKQIKCYSCIALLTACLILTMFLMAHYHPSGYTNRKIAKPVPPARIVLIPLDSRPPCREYPESLARAAGLEMMTPPRSLLDNYRQRADTAGLIHWLRTTAPAADCFILSVDMLVHGSLIASRLPAGTEADVQNALALLVELRRQYPHKHIYVFSVIPRLLVADTAENKQYQALMAQFSILCDKVAQFNQAEDIAELKALENAIPAPIRSRYIQMYQQSLAVNRALLNLVQNGVIDYLVVGQDDAHPFGIANMVKRHLQDDIRESIKPDKVFVTRGTDELALTLVARFANLHLGYRPRIFVEYSSLSAKDVVMPFMPNRVEQTVMEKIALVDGTVVQHPADADFLLYVHIGTPDTTPLELALAARQLKKYQAQGYSLAIVDLSQHFTPEHNLFPYLSGAGLDLARLTAYAGWNTTSNSVGTAVAQASIFHAGLGRAIFAVPQATEAANAHLAFLFSRYVDDWYYQKVVQPRVNQRLTEQGAVITDLGEHYDYACTLVREQLMPYAETLFRKHFARRKFILAGADRSVPYTVHLADLDITLPWTRTFEVRVSPHLDMQFTAR